MMPALAFHDALSVARATLAGDRLLPEVAMVVRIPPRTRARAVTELLALVGARRPLPPLPVGGRIAATAAITRARGIAELRTVAVTAVAPALLAVEARREVERGGRYAALTIEARREARRLRVGAAFACPALAPELTRSFERLSAQLDRRRDEAERRAASWLRERVLDQRLGTALAVVGPVREGCLDRYIALVRAPDGEVRVVEGDVLPDGRTVVATHDGMTCARVCALSNRWGDARLCLPGMATWLAARLPQPVTLRLIQHEVPDRDEWEALLTLSALSD